MHSNMPPVLHLTTITVGLMMITTTTTIMMTTLVTIGLSVAQEAPDDRPTGYFWHVTDLHYDPTYTYNSTNSPSFDGVSCGKDAAGARPPGPYGSYLCDSPWSLVRSSVQAMQQIKPDVDFIIWTGDDTPHNADDLVFERVAEIIGNLTEQILQYFPTTRVFPVLGNHDWYPKSQLPPRDDPFYATVAGIWSTWLNTSTAKQTFSRSGFYSMKLNEKVLLIGLNTNLYYDSNHVTASMPDPGNQLQWLDDTLTMAANDSLKVILIGHVPPGQFEKHPTKNWFRPYYNQLFVDLLRKHSRVFGSIHFGHHHTDSFRLFYDDQGVPTGSFFIAPAVTPWETTLAGVMGGKGNNPGVRLIEYLRSDGSVVNIQQYYLNLTEANEATAQGRNVTWKRAYDAKQMYSLQDMTAKSLKDLVDRMWKEDTVFNSYYQANGLYFIPNEVWTQDYRVVHCCAIEELDYKNYTTCFDQHTSGASGSNSKLTPVVMLLVAVVYKSLL